MDVLVVGAGTMGRWVAGVCAGAGWPVSLADRDPAVARAAAETVAASTDGSGSVRVADLGDDDRRFDAVCLAVPISAIEAAVRAHAPRAREAVFDVSGSMAGPVEAMAEVVPERERVSLHPLFAPGNEPGNVASVASGGPFTDQLHGLLRERGNEVFDTTPTEHDRAMRTVQAAAHAAVLAYGLAAEPVREEFHTPLSGPLSELVERLTGNGPAVYGEIQRAFPGAKAVAEAARAVADADEDRFAELYREAGWDR
jgi:prephenate dehydrogenase